METLRIAVVSTAVFPSPPRSYGGVEMVAYDLAEALARMGHRVTLIAPRGSRAPEGAELIETVEPQRAVHEDWLRREEEAYKAYRDRLGGFDVISDHSWFAFPYLYKAEHPEAVVLHTFHGHYAWPEPPPVERPCFVAISRYLAREVSARSGRTCRHAYNGVNLERYPFRREKEGYLVYVGRMTPYKGPHVAMYVARRLNTPIYMVGGETFVEDPGYVNRLRMEADGWIVRWVGECSHEAKVRLLSGARALLMPSQFGEPFGLVAVEAMACGTPVVAYRDGAIPEVVIDGRTGFLVDSPDDMVEACRRLDEIDPEECRRRAEEFSGERMAGRYLELFKEAMEGGW